MFRMAFADDIVMAGGALCRDDSPLFFPSRSVELIAPLTRKRGRRDSATWVPHLPWPATQRALLAAEVTSTLGAQGLEG